jgi:hypothetical protein
MLTLGCTFLVGPRLYGLPRAVESVRDQVDRLYALVDDRATPDVTAYLGGASVPYDLWRFDNQFVAGNNLAHERLGTDWGLYLDTDECLTAPPGSVRAAAESAEARNLDGVYTLRRHWDDLAMTQEFLVWAPNWAPRLRRGWVRFDGVVHPPAAGLLRLEEGRRVHDRALQPGVQ